MADRDMMPFSDDDSFEGVLNDVFALFGYYETTMGYGDRCHEYLKHHNIGRDSGDTSTQRAVIDLCERSRRCGSALPPGSVRAIRDSATDILVEVKRIEEAV